MATRKPIILIDGKLAELATGDRLANFAEEAASDAEARAGVLDDKAVTPHALRAALEHMLGRYMSAAFVTCDTTYLTFDRG